MIDWKSTLVFVIPAEAGNQAVFDLELKSNLDAGVRRHDILTSPEGEGFQPPARETGESNSRREILAARLLVILSSLGKTSDVELALRRIKLLATKISY